MISCGHCSLQIRRQSVKRTSALQHRAPIVKIEQQALDRPLELPQGRFVQERENAQRDARCEEKDADDPGALLHVL